MNTRPVRGIVVSYVDSPAAPDDYRKEVRTLTSITGKQLEKRGAEVTLVNAAEPGASASEALRDAAGLVIMGGVDIDPNLYGQDDIDESVHFLDADADEYEIALTQYATENGIPVFGICRGSQLINVALGGTLIQDLGTGIHSPAIITPGVQVSDVWADHSIEFVPGSKLRELFDEPSIEARVSHHQAVDVLGEGLSVAAHAEDGVVEAIESSSPWILGVQWHPEEPRGNPEDFGRLLDGFLAATRTTESQE